MEQTESQTYFEEIAYRAGHQIVAGVDEAGRGPLAGPVVAAACVLPRGVLFEEVDDSKKLTQKKREELYHMLVNHPLIDFGIGVVDHKRIDAINILRASLEAMALAVENLVIKPDFLLIDGNHLPPVSVPARAIVKGDSRSKSIGAASIIAKYRRDQLMEEYHLTWPVYGFDQHKGYPTRAHLRAIDEHGPCPIHRTSFQPIKSLLTRGI